jgi:hypothetical protein
MDFYLDFNPMTHSNQPKLWRIVGPLAVSFASVLIFYSTPAAAQQSSCSYRTINGVRVLICCDANGYCYRQNER